MTFSSVKTDLYSDFWFQSYAFGLMIIFSASTRQIHRRWPFLRTMSSLMIFVYLLYFSCTFVTNLFFLAGATVSENESFGLMSSTNEEEEEMETVGRLTNEKEEKMEMVERLTNEEEEEMESVERLTNADCIVQTNISTSKVNQVTLSF
jgi:hypothetical protein